MAPGASPNLYHRTEFTNTPETCACILREGWCAGTPKTCDTFGRGAFNSFTTVLAIRRGHLDCLKYAIENGCEWHRTALHMRMWSQGHYGCVTYAMESQVCVDDDVVEEVVRDCNHAFLALILPYWHAQNRKRTLTSCCSVWFTFMDKLFENRGGFGSDKIMACVKLLRETGCPWGENATKLAASKGYYDVLRYLADEGCPWHPDTVEAARASGKKDILAFAEKHATNLAQQAHISNLFDVLERHKRKMPDMDYINAAKAAKDLHDYFKRDIQRPA
jgi:hypothetical protein